MMDYTVSSGVTSTGIKLNAQDTLTVSSGGIASATVVNSGGTEYVLAGGQAFAGVIRNGGEFIFGSATGDKISGFGHVYVESGGVETGAIVAGTGGLVVQAKGLAISSTVSSGCTETVYGKTSGAQILGGEAVNSGGFSKDAVVSSGGAAYVYLSGTTNGMTVKAGGSMAVQGGTAIGTKLTGGSEFITSGATSGTLIGNGGSEDVGAGSSTGTVVSKGGSQYVESGGTAFGTVIKGGLMYLAGGAVVSGGISFSGKTAGTLEVESAALPSAVISGFAVNDKIQLDAINYVSGASATVATAGVVTITNGGTSYNLNIAGATVGETDFKVVSGQFFGLDLTKVKVKAAAMEFVRPAAAPAHVTAQSIAHHDPAPSARPAGGFAAAAVPHGYLARDAWAPMVHALPISVGVS